MNNELSKITEEDTIQFEGLAAVVAAKETILEAFNKVCFKRKITNSST